MQMFIFRGNTKMFLPEDSEVLHCKRRDVGGLCPIIRIYHDHRKKLSRFRGVTIDGVWIDAWIY
jgi:hypothetical protein